MKERALADVSTADRRARDRSEREAGLIPALTIVSHPLARRVGERLLLSALLAGKEVALSRNAPDFARSGASRGLPLADPFLSRKPLRFAPAAAGRLVLHVEAEGTSVVIGEPIRGSRELTLEELAAGVSLELAERVVLWLHLVASDEERCEEAFGMVGESAAVHRVRKQIERVADLDVPVLIRGETGTGKELIARAIHERSPRRNGPFVSVNLGAIPKELAAAELFGAVKGSYTGATQGREGIFRAAHGGTLFLDELGEASPEIQVLLLRVLESGEMYPVGAQTPVATNARLLAATDANLEEHIRQERFKAPLLHRLTGYEIRVPPLRERREDIGLLFHHFARGELESLGEAHRLEPEDPYAEPWLPAPLATRLVCHPWPGNIRQLRNVVRKLVIGSRGSPRLRVDPQLAQELASHSLPPPGQWAVVAEAEKPAPRRKPSDISEQELLAALREQAWDLQATADRLGIPRTSVYNLIEKIPSIRVASDLSPAEIEQCYRDCRGDLDAMVQRLEVSKRALRRRLKELGLGQEDAPD